MVDAGAHNDAHCADAPSNAGTTHSGVQVSTTVSTRSLLPLCSASLMKSIAQRWFGSVAAGRTWRAVAIRRRLGRFARRQSPSSR